MLKLDLAWTGGLSLGKQALGIGLRINWDGLSVWMWLLTAQKANAGEAVNGILKLRVQCSSALQSISDREPVMAYVIG